jgi:3-oxoacyl-[acyl-carrier-protein] synthase-3
MKIIIKDIASNLPEQIVTNQDLHKSHPEWNMDLVGFRTGVEQRHIAQKDETALDLAVGACRRIFDNNEGLAEKIDGVIFCTQSADYIMPPNACVLHKELELKDDIFAFDFNLACSGYVYGLALAQGLISSGMLNDILFVTGDTYSKYIHDDDRSAKVLFGDGAAVSWITASDSSAGILDIQCSTSGKDFEKFIIPAGGNRAPFCKETKIVNTDYSGSARSLENIHMDGTGILVFVNSKTPKQILDILGRNQLKIEDIDLFVFHQASKMALDSLTRILNIEPEKVFQNLNTVGNTVSSSIPIALEEAKAQGRLKAGGKVLLSGFGVGLSWATAIMEI